MITKVYDFFCLVILRLMFNLLVVLIPIFSHQFEFLFYRWIRWTIISVCLFFLVIFWTIPVAFVSALVSLQSLQEKVEFLEFGTKFVYFKDKFSVILSVILYVTFYIWLIVNET